jgi:hypothetical protein
MSQPSDVVPSLSRESILAPSSYLWSIADAQQRRDHG